MLSNCGLLDLLSYKNFYSLCLSEGVARTCRIAIRQGLYWRQQRGGTCVQGVDSSELGALVKRNLLSRCPLCRGRALTFANNSSFLPLSRTHTQPHHEAITKGHKKTKSLKSSRTSEVPIPHSAAASSAEKRDRSPRSNQKLAQNGSKQGKRCPHAGKSYAHHDIILFPTG